MSSYLGYPKKCSYIFWQTQSLAKYCVKAGCLNTHIPKRVYSVLSTQLFLVFSSNLAFAPEKEKPNAFLGLMREFIFSPYSAFPRLRFISRIPLQRHIYLPPFDINIFYSNLGSISHPESLFGAFSDKGVLFFHKNIIVIFHICNMYQAFYKISLKLYKKAKTGNTRYNTVIDLSNLIFHKLGFFKVNYLPFCLHGISLPVLGVSCNFRQASFPMLLVFFRISSFHYLFENPMNYEVRVSADRRCKMGIIFKCQTKVADVFFRILCLLH